MLQDIEYRGVWVRVGRSGDETVEGWLVGELPQGLLIALDDDARDVRLVDEYDSISYDHDRRHPTLHLDNAEAVAESLDEANETIAVPLRMAISRLNFPRLHDCGHEAFQLSRRIRMNRVDLRRVNGDELVSFLIAEADRSTAIHRDVYDTLTESGISDVISKVGPQLVALPPELTLPLYDLEFASRSSLVETLTSARDTRWTQRRHDDSLESAEQTRQRLVHRTRQSQRSSETERGRPDDTTTLSRWIGPSLRIIAGTGLAIANASVGVAAGLTTTLTTIGATAVPTYVGVATSIYTGLTQAADGLEKIGRRK